MIGRFIKLVDGKLVLMNPPTVLHFLIAKFLEQALDREIQRLQRPWLTFREAGVQISDRKSRLTDVCVVTQEQAQELLHSSAVFRSPPLLIVEVVSPESVSRDYRYKRSEYAARGIQEYWIIDPIQAKVTVLTLVDGLYEESCFAGEEAIASPLFPSLNLKASEILQT